MCDELAKLNEQAQAVMASLICENHVRSLNDSVVAHLAWMVDDSLGKMKWCRTIIGC